MFRNLLSIVLLCLSFLVSQNVALASYTATDLSNANAANPPSKNQKDHGWKLGIAKAVFDPSANSSDRAIGAHALSLTLPKNTTVTKCYYKVLTTFTSSTDAATIAIKIASANDIVTATAISAGSNVWDASGIVIGTPTGSMANEIALTAESTLTATVAVEDLTAGKLVIWCEWVYYGDV